MSKPETPPAPPPPEMAGRATIWELFRALSLDAGWPGLDTIVLQARAAGMSLAEVHSLTRAMRASIASLPAPDRAAMAAQIRGAKHQAALLILDRTPGGPWFALEREAVLSAAELLLEVDLPAEAAAVFERAGDDGRAAQAWGAAGEIERMEACLAREQEQRNARHDLRDLAARFETLMLAGQRLAALDLVAGAEGGEAHGPKARAAEVERRLTPGRRLALRAPDGTILHFAGLPALLGREGQCQVLLRDPGVSRRHARLSYQGSRFFVEDSGSRAGTYLCGARLAGCLPLPPVGELSLGDSCRLSVRVHGAEVLELGGLNGWDRGLRAWLGPGALPLPGAESLSVVPLDRAARINVTSPVRLNGKLVGTGFEVVQGDIIECGTVRLEAV